MTRHLADRLTKLETSRQAQHRRAPTTPVYTIIREGDPRPDVDGPVYQLVTK